MEKQAHANCKSQKIRQDMEHCIQDLERNWPGYEFSISFCEKRMESEDLEELDSSPLCEQQAELMATLERILARTTSRSGEYFQTTAVSLWEKAHELHYRIMEKYTNPQDYGYEAESYVQLENKLRSALASARTLDIDLFPLTLPKFYGDILKWREFYELFTQHVENSDWTERKKMELLQASVIGEPERLIRDLADKGGNYHLALHTLEEAYNRPWDVANLVIGRFLTLGPKEDESPAAVMGAILQGTRETVDCLQRQGIDTATWDPILIAAINQKLKPFDQYMYAKSLGNSKEMPTLETMLQFLEQRMTQT